MAVSELAQTCSTSSLDGGGYGEPMRRTEQGRDAASQRRILATLSAPALLTLIEHAINLISAQVFLVAPTGVLLLANQAATAQLAADAGPLRKEIGRAAVRGVGKQLSVQRVSVSAGIDVAWIIRAERRFDLDACSAIAARRWGLTARQHVVLALVLNGRSNKQIATSLECAENTVEVHVSAVLRKSGSKSRAHLIRQALELALR
jgi:DNA-binding CsgD family transcriptional regulator